MNHIEHGLFVAMVLLVALQRLIELRKSRRHEKLLARRGGFEVAGGHFPWMRWLHATWLLAMLLESFIDGRPPGTFSLVVYASLFLAGQCLRAAAMEALGPRWTARIYCLPGEPLVKSGIYRHLAHPNYLGVALEIFALPMLYGCSRTALIFSIGNAAVLAVRIKCEVSALRHYAGVGVGVNRG